MAISGAKTRRKHISMTSLIDVIFLLLLFFMLSSTFTRFAEIPLTGASAGQGAASAETPLLFVRLFEEQIELNGKSHAIDELSAQISQMEIKEGQQLLVAPDDTVTSQRLVDLLVVLAAYPDLTVVVLE
ncbi:biopolymer transporter ExbD [Loktanella sp. D2R18]|uniref:biopolymer transporter ExbD n=1 Tax=Rhodobacterales TaxID=204455 RepID=UPI000DEBF4DF|nr:MULTISPECIES: biopolymer transporter ExbD [Rhodobacterales]MDO6591227.1 biopolymer transporter ExbD [Yoonia sp. 1_MG-2023]RBW41488.1 biopolymer transporter ExbD [Loktanella sp. D2R18]